MHNDSGFNMATSMDMDFDVIESPAQAEDSLNQTANY